MGINKAAERFMLLSGIEEEELLRWMPVVVDAVEYVKSLLKSGVNAEDNSDLLSSAAGTYAYYKWSIYNNSSDIKSFKAGDITVTEDSTKTNSNNALKLWRQCLDEISFLTKDSKFFFEGVLA